MEALLRAGKKADQQRKHKRPHPKSAKGKSPEKPTSSEPTEDSPADKILSSITPGTSQPKFLTKFSASSSTSEPFNFDKGNKFTPYAFQRQLNSQTQWQKDTKAALKDAEILVTQDQGQIIAEGELERTWRLTQNEIVKSVGEEQARYRKEWKLDGGSYRTRYSKNGRHVAIVGKKGHVASFDWQTGKMHCELQLRETCRDITYLNDHSHIAVAQKQHVYIYDQQGIELHRLREHIDITRLDYLPYHWLLVSVGNPGVLRYHDTSVGRIVATHKTKLGACHTMAQNPHNAVIYLGHQNGTVTLWTPNLDEPAVKLQAHLGGVTSLSVDPSKAGRYLATAGMDGRVKVWDCRNWKGCVREWEQRGTGHAELDWSQKGFLGVASGGTVNVYTPNTIITAHPGHPPLYLTHPIPQRPLTSVRFCPFTDMLTIGHNGGLSSIIVPGAGEPTFDSAEADPFESKKKRREREVHNLLDKIPHDLIALDADLAGNVAEDEEVDEFAQPKRIPDYKLPRQEKLRRAGVVDDSEPRIVDPDKEELELGYSASDSSESEYEAESGAVEGQPPAKKKKRSALKVYQKKAGKNVVDPTIARIRAKMALRRREIEVARSKTALTENRKPSALDRFRRPVKS